jgi:hypothetical protein
MTAGNAYRNLDATIRSQHCTVLNISNLQSPGHLSALLHIYLFISNLITSLSLNPIVVLILLYDKLCRAVLA